MSHLRALVTALILPILVAGCAINEDSIAEIYTLADPDGDGALNNIDCGPDDAAVHPGADDPWGDEIDQDCDGYDGVDRDGDGAPAAGFGTTPDIEDCDDFDAAINPDALEECDSLDSDCDGSLVDEDTDLDEDGIPDCVDTDVDGDGAASDEDCDDLDASLNLSDADLDSETSCDGDCDDDDDTVGSAATELCDGKDNDCNELIDDGLPEDGIVYYADADLDGHGDPNTTVAACAQPDGYLSWGGDCDDSDASLNQDDADGDGETSCDGDCDDLDGTYATSRDELCDGLDNDCDTEIPANELDSDGDGWVVCAWVGLVALPGATAGVFGGGDCDDDDILISPAATEVCDGVDNDCDGGIDDTVIGGEVTSYADADSDNYGDPAVSVTQCGVPTGYVADSTDCDDTDGAVYPGAAEVCDATDSDCDNSVVDEDVDTDGDLEPDCTDLDDDGDNHLDVVDCAPLDATINALAVEVCDSVDNNCDSVIDEDSAQDATPWYADLDGDGHAGSIIIQLACSAPSGFQASFDDCDDLDGSSYPQATEICDGSDNDCNTLIDDNAADASNWYADTDGDGYGDIGSVTTACEAPTGSVADSTDCNDGSAAISPAATDVPGDGVDNDCAGGDAPLGTFLGDLTLTNDAGLGFFCSQYDTLYGSLTVQGSSVTDLTDLSCLREIYGTLWITSTSVVTASLPNLTLIQGSFAVIGNSQLTTLSVPALTAVQDLEVNSNSALESLSTDALTAVERLVLGGRMDTLSMPLLASAGDVFIELSGPTTTALSLPALAQVDDLYVINNNFLETLDLPQLAQARSVTLESNSALSTFSLPALTTLAAPTVVGDDDDVVGDDDDVVGDDDDVVGDDDDDDDTSSDDDDDATINDCLNLPTVNWLDFGGVSNIHVEAASGCTPTSTANLGNLTVAENASLTTIELPVLTAVGELYLSQNQSLIDLSAASLAEVVTLRVQYGNGALTSFAGLTALTSLGELHLRDSQISDLSHLAAASATGCLLSADGNENLSNADFVALRDALDPSQSVGVSLYYNGDALDGDGDGVPASDDCNDSDGNEGEPGNYYWGPVDGDGDGFPRQYCAAGYGCLSANATPPATATLSTGGPLDDDCDDGDPTIKPGVVDICYDGINQNCSGLIDDGVDSDGDGVPDCYDCDDTDPGVLALNGSSSCPAYSCLTLQHAANEGWLAPVIGDDDDDDGYEIDPEGTGAFTVLCRNGWTKVGLGWRYASPSELVAWNSDAVLNLGAVSPGGQHGHLSADQVNAILRGGITDDPTSIRDMWANCEDSRGPGTDRYWRGVGTYRWSAFTSTDPSEAYCYYGNSYEEYDEAEVATWAPNHHYGLVCQGNMITSHNLYPGIAYPWYCDSSHNVDIEIWAR